MENYCMFYAGAVTPKGYAQKSVKINGVWYNRPLHREMYIALVGEIPEGLVLDHLCRNRSCINVEHMQPVTSGVNTRRGINSNRLKTHCKHGHEYTESNTRKLIHQKGYTYRICLTCLSERQHKFYMSHK
ncbi:MAG: hypothetical protein JWR59_2513 [Brevundimonas sp.]|nr:hypothetical protein [Brevundimonas sp.]